MEPRKALEFLAAAAQSVYPINRSQEYNAAVTALVALVELAESKSKEPEQSATKADKKIVAQAKP